MKGDAAVALKLDSVVDLFDANHPTFRTSYQELPMTSAFAWKPSKQFFATAVDC